MGADNFAVDGYGATVKEAFNAAVDHAQYMNGHGGYTGTIAEKDSYILLTPPAGVTPKDYATWLIHDHVPVPKEYEAKVERDRASVDDKWGPAGAIELAPSEKYPGKKHFVFFGWASS